MKTKDKGAYTEISAEEGKFLTQAELGNDEERIFILVACTIHPEQWVEWTTEQREAWETEHPLDMDEVITNEEEEI